MAKTEYEENIELDAILVHSAMLGMFEPAAIQLGLSPSEAFGRAAWLKRQSEEYITKVSNRVVELEDKNENRKSKE